MKRIIIGFATNMSRHSTAIFLRSARKSHPDNTDICLITNQMKDIKDIVEETDAIIFYTPSTYSPKTGKSSKLLNRWVIHQMRLLYNLGLLGRMPEAVSGYHTMLEAWHHPHFARWIAYLRLLNLFGHRYYKVFLADVKDIAFQADAFMDVTPQSVSLYRESYTFENEYYNREWIIKGFGQRSYEKIKNELPICVGTMAGSPTITASLISEFVGLFARSPFRTIEQGIFNHALLNGHFETSVTQIDNFSGACATMAGKKTDDMLEIVGQHIVLKESGSIVPVLHGYDRYPHFEEFIYNQYINL
ncbi:MAG: hypothetical protein AB3N28_08865 [Kordiimonas sp.]